MLVGVGSGRWCGVRQLRHHFWTTGCSFSSSLCHRTFTPRSMTHPCSTLCVFRSMPMDLMLIGACNPMLCPIHDVRFPPGKSPAPTITRVHGGPPTAPRAAQPAAPPAPPAPPAAAPAAAYSAASTEPESDDPGTATAAQQVAPDNYLQTVFLTWLYVDRPLVVGVGGGCWW